MRHILIIMYKEDLIIRHEHKLPGSNRDEIF